MINHDLLVSFIRLIISNPREFVTFNSLLIIGRLIIARLNWHKP